MDFGMGKNIILKALPVAFFAAFFFLPAALVLLQAAPLVFSGKAFEILALHQKQAMNSFVQAIFSTALSFAIGFPAAYIFSKMEFKGKQILSALSFVPFVFPSILVAIFFVIIFGYNGWINRILMGLFGLSDPPIQVLYGFWGIVLAHAFYNFPIFMRLISGALVQNEKEEQAASSLGATPLQVFWRVTFPRILPSILFGCAIVFAYSFMSFAIVLTIGGPANTNLEVGVFYEIARQADFGAASVLAFAQFALLSFLAGAFILFSGNIFFEHEFFPEQKTGEGKKSDFGFLVAAAFVFVVVLLPVLALFSFATGLNAGNFSLHQFSDVFFSQKKSITGATAMTSIFFSLAFALLAASTATLVGLLGAISFREKKLAGALFATTIALSPITLGFGYILGFGSGHWWLIVFGHAVLALPFAYGAISERVSRIPQNMIFAAQSLGAGPAQRFFQIELPQIRGVLSSVFAFSFAVSIGELSLAMLLSEGKYPTMTVQIQRLVSTYNIQGAAALGIVLVLFAGAAFYLINKSGEKNEA